MPIRDRWPTPGAASMGPVKVTIRTVQIWLVDDLAHETGTWTYTYTPKGKPEESIGGRYVTSRRRQADAGSKIKSDLGVPAT